MFRGVTLKEEPENEMIRRRDERGRKNSAEKARTT